MTNVFLFVSYDSVMSETTFLLGFKKPKILYQGQELQKIQINLLEQKPSDVPLSVPIISVAVDYVPFPRSGTHVELELPLIGGSIVVEGVKIVAEALKIARDKKYKITKSDLSNEHHELNWAIPPTKKKMFRLYSGPTKQSMIVYGPNETGAEIMIVTPVNPGGSVLGHDDPLEGKFEWVDIRTNSTLNGKTKLTGKFELHPN